MLFDLDLQRYININRDYLFSFPEGRVGFPVYARITNNLNDSPVLLFKEESEIGAIKKILKAKHYNEICIRQEDQNKFLDYIEASLEKIVADDSIPLDKKTTLIYQCATDTVKAVLKDPRSGENIGRAKKVTNNIINLTLSNPASVPSLLSLGSHNYYTFTHCVNVAVFSIGMWQAMGLPDNEPLKQFGLGCMLHDVGKTKIPDKILNKPGKLTKEEFDIIKQHPALGKKMMDGMVPGIALDVIMHHHERYDGTGYPEGLKGEQVSDFAKIAIIADVYDALTTKRSYAEAESPFKAMMVMKEEMMGHFEQDKFVKFIYFLGNKKN